MFKPSRRAAVIAASFALGLSCAGPYAHASLLGGDDSDSTTVEGFGLPVAGDVLGDGVFSDGLLGDGGVLGLVGGGLLGDGLPLVGGLLGDGDDSVLAGEGVVEALGGLPDLGVVPGGGSVLEVLSAFSDSGSLVPGLQVLEEIGLLGLLGNL